MYGLHSIMINFEAVSMAPAPLQILCKNGHSRETLTVEPLVASAKSGCVEPRFSEDGIGCRNELTRKKSTMCLVQKQRQSRAMVLTI